MKEILVVITICCMLFQFDAHAVNLKRLNATPFKRSVGFIKWYMRHKNQVYRFYPIDEHPGDSTKLYKLDHRQLNKYLKYLKQAGYLSDYYLFRRKLYFIDIGATLKNIRNGTARLTTTN